MTVGIRTSTPRIKASPSPTRVKPTATAAQPTQTSIPTGPSSGPVILAHEDPIRALAFSPDGQQLATGSSNGKILILDMATIREAMPSVLHTLALPAQYAETGITSLSFSKEASLLAAGTNAGAALVWDLAAGGASPKPSQTVLPVKAVEKKGFSGRSAST